VLDEALGLLDHHFGNLDVALRRLVEGRGNDLALHAALHVGHFLRPLVDEQDEEEDLRMVVGDRLGDVLQQHRLAGARRGDDQGALALALRGDDVDHPRRFVLHRRIGGVESQLAVRIERREIVEIDPVADRLRIVEIDLGDAQQAEIALAVPRTLDLALDRVAGPEAELADEIRRDIDIVRPGQVIGVGRAEEAESVLQHLDRAAAHDLVAIFGADLEDREHQLLLAQGRGALDSELFRQRHQLGRRLLLEFFEIHNVSRNLDTESGRDDPKVPGIGWRRNHPREERRAND